MVPIRGRVTQEVLCAQFFGNFLEGAGGVAGSRDLDDTAAGLLGKLFENGRAVEALAPFPAKISVKPSVHDGDGVDDDVTSMRSFEGLAEVYLAPAVNSVPEKQECLAPDLVAEFVRGQINSVE